MPQGVALAKKLFSAYLWQTLVIAALILAAATVCLIKNEKRVVKLCLPYESVL